MIIDLGLESWASRDAERRRVELAAKIADRFDDFCPTAMFEAAIDSSIKDSASLGNGAMSMITRW